MSRADEINARTQMVMAKLDKAKVALREVTEAIESVHRALRFCLFCARAIPLGTREHAKYCSGSCRSLDCQRRKAMIATQNEEVKDVASHTS